MTGRLSRIGVWKAVHRSLLVFLLAASSVSWSQNQPAHTEASDLMDLALEGFIAYQKKEYVKLPLLLLRVKGVAAQNNDRSGQAMVAFGQSLVFRKMKLEGPAKGQIDTTKKLLREMPSESDRALTAALIGFGSRMIGDVKTGEEFLALAATTADEKDGDVKLLVGILYSLVELDIGSYQTAFAQLHRVEECLEQAPPQLRVLFHHTRGRTYLRTRQMKLAEEALKQALQVLGDIEKPLSGSGFSRAALAVFTEKALLESLCHRELAMLSYPLGRYDEAIEHGEAGIAAAKRARIQFGISNIMIGLANVYDRVGRRDEAIVILKEALQIAEARGNRAQAASLLGRLGSVHQNTRENSEALSYYRRALELRKEAGRNIHGELSHIGDLQERMGNLDAAISNKLAAIELREKQRASLGQLSQAKLSFFASTQSDYLKLVRLLTNVGRREEAFRVLERAKSQVLLDLMATSEVDLNRGLPASEVRAERALAVQVERASQALVAAMKRGLGRAKIEQLDAVLVKAQGDLESHRADLYDRYPSVARNRVEDTLDRQQLAGLIDDETVLLSCFFDPALRILIATRERGAFKLTHQWVWGEKRKLAEWIQRFAAACSQPDGDYDKAGKEIHYILLRRLAKHLEGKRRLVVIPDGPLWQLSMQALPSLHREKGKFLGDEFEIIYAPSATALHSFRERAQSKARWADQRSALIVADPKFSGAGNDAERSLKRAGWAGDLPPLPGTAVEADTIQSLLPDSCILKQEQALESRFKAESGGYRYLHLATHGLFSSEHPMESGLLFTEPTTGGEDGLLTAREISQLDWNAEMIVFSACNSGRGRETTGEGLVGISWAAFIAGAPTQVVSQWAVNDATTAFLMSRFYSHLNDGKTKGAALRQAAADLRQRKAPVPVDATRGAKVVAGTNDKRDYSHPYYWAPFILIGNWE